MIIRNIPARVMVIAVAFVAGCTAAGLSRVELNYGAALESARVKQIYPVARSMVPVKGIDGSTAAIIMEKYREGFKKTKPPKFIIPVGEIEE